MAQNKVTGKTRAQIEDLREQFKGQNGAVFEDSYCLSPINKQPPDYDGPQRYCSIKNSVYEIGNVTRCKFHGGKNELHPENLDKLAPMTHGMKALRRHVREDFDEKDRALYDWIVDKYVEAYDLDLDNDPNVAYDLHKYAVEAVRAERGRGHLIREGEIHEKDRYDDEGNLVIDRETGEVVTEKSQHYLADMLHRQDKKLLKMEKELGLTRKEQQRQESTDDAVAAIKNFSDLGSKFLSRDEKEYDPDERPWKEDNEPDS